MIQHIIYALYINNNDINITSMIIVYLVNLVNLSIQNIQISSCLQSCNDVTKMINW